MAGNEEDNDLELQNALDRISEACEAIQASEGSKSDGPPGGGSPAKLCEAALEHLAAAKTLIRRANELQAKGVDSGDPDGHVSTRQSKGGWQYRFQSLLEALLLARLIQCVGELPTVLVRSLGFCIGSATADVFYTDLQKNLVHVPSPSSLSRARLKMEPCFAFLVLNCDCLWL